MKNSVTILLILGTLSLLSACSNTLQTRNTSPYFDGVLKFNGEAIANAKIILSLHSNDTLCHKEAKLTHTDEQGEFSISASKQAHSYTPFLNYQLDEWIICAEVKSQRYTLYSNNRYAMGSVVESLFLNCDLANRPLNKLCVVSH